CSRQKTSRILEGAFLYGTRLSRDRRLDSLQTLQTSDACFQDVDGISSHIQILAFNNTHLEDHRTLESYNIESALILSVPPNSIKQ
ncbi:hypothetical protein JG687_00015141, partial [Phytophthora cactorum]